MGYIEQYSSERLIDENRTVAQCLFQRSTDHLRCTSTIIIPATTLLQSLRRFYCCRNASFTQTLRCRAWDRPRCIPRLNLSPGFLVDAIQDNQLLLFPILDNVSPSSALGLRLTPSFRWQLEIRSRTVGVVPAKNRQFSGPS